MEMSSQSRALLAAQQGMLTRRQLLDAGVTKAEMRSRLSTRWRVVLPGVVLLDRDLPNEEQRLQAALLFGGPESWLAGPTAAALHGLRSCRVANPIYVRVPVPRRSRTSGWVIVKNTTLVDERLIERGPLRLSCVARAVVDAAAVAPTEDDARSIMIEATQRRIARVEDLKHWVHIRGTQNGARLRRALAEAASGVWSLPEADLLRLLSSSKVLPPMMANPELKDAAGIRLTTPDAWIDDVAMAVMVHSRRFHGGELDWENTVEADSDLSTSRVVVLGVTPRSILREPARVLARVERAYLAARTSGFRANVTATPQRGLWVPEATAAEG